MKKSYALRKGRYVVTESSEAKFVTKIKDSNIVHKYPVMFNIFNFPVECIELDRDNILVIDRYRGLEVKTLSQLIDERYYNLKAVFYIEDGKLYAPLSTLNFAKPETVERFRELRASR